MSDSVRPAHDAPADDDDLEADLAGELGPLLRALASPPAEERGFEELRPGARVGRFELTGLLGRGGFGVVYEAQDLTLQRPVALKFLSRASSRDGDLEAFQREARAIARLNHPGVVVLHDAQAHEGQPFLVMERLSGETLRTRLRRGPLPLPQAVEVARLVSHALAEAHANELIHRDIKPSNVFLLPGGGAKLLDFGVAHLRGERMGEGRSGTPAYMAPEQWRGEGQDARTDVFSLGLLLFEMLTGARAYPVPRSRDDAGPGTLLGGAPPLSLLAFLPRAPAPLVHLLERACAGAREARFPTAAELAAALDAVAAPLATQHRADGPYHPLQPLGTADDEHLAGRADAVAALQARLDTHPVVLLEGPSGAGKTSLLCAGLLPRLRAAGWQTVTLEVSTDPMAALAAHLRELLAEDDDSSLHDRLCAHAAATERPLLLAIDAVERLGDSAAHRGFAGAIGALLAALRARPEGQVHLLLVLREGTAARHELRALTEALSPEARQRLGALPRAALAHALLAPARDRGVRLEPALVAEVVESLTGVPSAPALLQLVAARLWSRRAAEATCLGPEALDALGGIGRALAAHATQVHAGLEAAEAALAEQLLLRLVLPSGAGTQLHCEELTAQGLGATCAHLLDARVLGSVGDEGGQLVGLSHPALASTWEVLDGWLERAAESRRQSSGLAQATALWRAAGRAQDLLWRGRRLRDELARRGAGADALPAEERSFLEASRRGVQRRRLRLGALALVGVAVGALAATFSLARVEDQRAAALQPALRDARTARAHAALQVASGAADPRLALLLAAELGEEDEPEGGLRSLLEVAGRHAPAAVLRGHGGPLTRVAMSPDGRRVLTAARDRTARLADADGRGVARVLPHGGDVISLAFSPDGRLVATGTDDGGARLWPDDGPPRDLAHPHWVTDLAFSADGGQLLTACADGRARLWRVADGRLLAEHAHAAPLRAVRFFGGQLLSAAEDGTLHLWRTSTATSSDRRLEAGGRLTAFAARGDALVVGTEAGAVRAFTGAALTPHLLVANGAPVQALALSAGGRVAAGFADGAVRTWADASAEAEVHPRLHEGGVTALAFERTGERLASAGADGSLLWWRRRGSPRRLGGHTAAVTALAFGPGDRRLVSASADHSARVWRRWPREPLRFGGERPDSSVGGLVFDRAVRSLAFSPDGSLVATSEATGVARLWPTAGGPPRTLRGHQDAVLDARFSPDGRRVVTASRDGTARVTPLEGGAVVSLRGHTDAVVQARFSPDGRQVLTASSDGTARLWPADGHAPPRILRHPAGGAVLDVDFSPRGDALVTASGRDAYVWSLTADTPPLPLQGHAGVILRARFVAEGRAVVTADHDGRILVHSLEGPCPPTALGGGGGALGALVVSRDGRRLLGHDGRGAVHLWDRATAAPLRSVPGPRELAAALTFSADGRRAYTASDDGRLLALGLDGAELPLRELARDLGAVRLLEASADGRWLAIAAHGGRAWLWDLAQERLRPLLDLGGFRLVGTWYRLAHLSPDGSLVASADLDGTLRLSPADGARPPRLLRAEGHQPSMVKFSPDGRWLASAAGDGDVRLWSVHAGVATRLVGHTRWIGSVGFSPDSRLLVTASGDTTARLWRTDGSLVRVLQGHTAGVLDAGFSPDGQAVLTASFDGTARRWPTGGGAPRIFDGHRGLVSEALESPRGGTVATISHDRAVRLWEPGAAGSRLLGQHDGPVNFVRFRPDGQRLLTSSYDHTARVWTLDGAPPVALRGHQQLVWTAEYSPDGARVVTASDDGTVRLWRDDGRGQPVVLGEGRVPYTHAAFDARGARVLGSLGNGPAHLWQVAWAPLLQRLRGAVGDCLSEVERARYLGEPTERARAAHAACEARLGRGAP